MDPPLSHPNKKQRFSFTEDRSKQFKAEHTLLIKHLQKATESMTAAELLWLKNMDNLTSEEKLPVMQAASRLMARSNTISPLTFQISLQPRSPDQPISTSASSSSVAAAVNIIDEE